MKKINVVLNSKGGVGKSTISILIAITAAFRGLDFEYIEIDNSNSTIESFAESEVLKDKMTSVKTDKSQEELYKATYKAMKEEKIIVIDTAGGDESIQIIELLKNEFHHVEINYILPFENSHKQMSNLINTYNKIDNQEATYLVKNKMVKDDEYIFFEGDKTLDIPSIRKEIKPVNKVFEIQNSDTIQMAEITQESILDLAQLAIEYSSIEASKIFIDEAKDMNDYNKLMTRYSKAQKALKEIKHVSAEFEELFNE